MSLCLLFSISLLHIMPLPSTPWTERSMNLPTPPPLRPGTTDHLVFPSRYAPLCFRPSTPAFAFSSPSPLSTMSESLRLPRLSLCGAQCDRIASGRAPSGLKASSVSFIRLDGGLRWAGQVQVHPRSLTIYMAAS